MKIIIFILSLTVSTSGVLDSAYASQPYHFVRKFSSARFDNLAVCPDRGYLVGVNKEENSITVLNIITGAIVAAIRPLHESSVSEINPKEPFGVACDEKEGRIIITETENKRLEIFDLRTFSFIRSVETAERYGSIVLDRQHDRIFAVVLSDDSSRAGHGIQILNLTTFSPVGDPLMMSWADGDAHERLMYADNLAIDEKDGILLVTDLGNARFDMFDLDKLANVGVYGVPNGFYDYGLRNVHPNNPGGITFDATTGYIFVVDDKKMRRIQIFNEKSGFLGSVTNEHLVTPEKLISNKGRLFVVDIDSDTNEWCVNLFESSANRTYRQDLTDP